MILYCVSVNLGDTWRNVWCRTKDEAILMAKDDDTVVAVYTDSDKPTVVDLLNKCDMHISNLYGIEGVGEVLKIWPTKTRRNK